VAKSACRDSARWRHAWRQLADGRIYVWFDRHWVPGGAVFWGMNDGFGPPQPQFGFFELGLRRGEFIRRYGQDNYYLYGPGHFGNG
jgi:hypothetical protein